MGFSTCTELSWVSSPFRTLWFYLTIAWSLPQVPEAVRVSPVLAASESHLTASLRPREGSGRPRWLMQGCLGTRRWYWACWWCWQQPRWLVCIWSSSRYSRDFTMEWSETLRGRIGKMKIFVSWENRLFWLSNLKQKEGCYWQKVLKKHDLKWVSNIEGTVSSVGVCIWMENSFVRCSTFIFFWSLSFQTWPETKTVEHIF